MSCLEMFLITWNLKECFVGVATYSNMAVQLTDNKVHDLNPDC